MADQTCRGQGLSRDELQKSDDRPGAAVEQEGLGGVSADTPLETSPFEVAYNRVEVPHVVSPLLTCEPAVQFGRQGEKAGRLGPG